MQNPNELWGGDHQPQTRLSCIVFAARVSSLIWGCQCPTLRQLFGGFIKVLLLPAHAIAGQQTLR